ncbi:MULTISPECIES: DUF4124 domain-containing protein [Psychrobacter]|jgi:hypothetical protein|uniref:DUF4124 domain-containing protein n=1 Tax=Psychrobacter TaxID=497 RepID=UPI000ED8FEB0|nr:MULTISPECIES: DUF4124 domain-containing protein [Psychrobacter]HCN17592.1 DUF4124 domain-containing protein [Psychrobacter sp.]
MTTLSKPRFLKGGFTVGLLGAMIISAATLCVTIANAAPIYKVIDEKTGQVTFTDRPQSYEQQADKKVSQMAITTDTTSDTTNQPNNSHTNSQPAAIATRQTAAVPSSNTKTVAPINYQLAITEPNEERAYRRPAQTINVRVQVTPALQAGHSISIYFDESEVAQGLSASLATINLLPGSHTIKAVVKDEKDQTLQQVTRTVYVIQNNTTLQNNKKIAQQLLAYQNLPWHQKVLLKLRQKETATP